MKHFIIERSRSYDVMRKEGKEHSLVESFPMKYWEYHYDNLAKIRAWNLVRKLENITFVRLEEILLKEN